MTYSIDLDLWADNLQDTLELVVVRDPSLIYPPCVFIDTPAVTKRTAQAITIDVPVFLVAPGPGDKAASDYLLDHIEQVLVAIGQNNADPRALTVGDTTHPTLRAVATLTISMEGN